MSRLGQLSELVGTILLASSLAGQERIECWQSHIKRLLNIRELAQRLGKRYRHAFERIFNVLIMPITVVMFALIFVNAIMPEGFPSSIYILTHSDQHDPMFFLSLFTVIVSPCAIILLILMASVLWEDLWEMAEKSGKALAKAIVFIICSVLLTPRLVAYSFIYVLLSPYLLAEIISIRLGLRPALGVLGTLIVLLGLTLQLLA